jgi:hypothetical protein
MQTADGNRYDEEAEIVPAGDITSTATVPLTEGEERSDESPSLSGD